jgi:predicted secreted Zn-dependent protease
MSAPEALMKRVSLTLAACVAAALLAPQAGAASVSKTYSYFTIGGVTLEQIETELNTRGPHVNSTGRRHPGATQMEFTTRLGYTTSAKGCSLTKVQVTVDAKVILPRWRNRSTASGDTALVWDTLSADIKRHEESHVSIAKNHGRELEDQLKAIGRQKDCETVAAQAKTITDQVLARHDAAQDRFDRIEGINFESRLLRLLQYRIGNASAKRPEG